MADASYQPGVYREQGGNRMVVKSGASLDVESSGEIDIESGGSLKLAGTALTASAAELNQYVINVHIPDISAAQSVFVVAPHAGAIAAIYTTIQNAITVGDAAITAEIGGVAVTGSAITIANAGSAAGTVDSSTPTAANVVTAGQAIEIITDGGSTDACLCWVSIVITR